MWTLQICTHSGLFHVPKFRSAVIWTAFVVITFLGIDIYKHNTAGLVLQLCFMLYNNCFNVTNNVIISLSSLLHLSFAEKFSCAFHVEVHRWIVDVLWVEGQKVSNNCTGNLDSLTFVTGIRDFDLLDSSCRFPKEVTRLQNEVQLISYKQCITSGCAVLHKSPPFLPYIIHPVYSVPRSGS